MTLTLRYMTVNDIPQVVNIDRYSFSTPWSARSYAYEITESAYSYMVVLEYGEARTRGWRRWLQGLNSPPVMQPRIIGYGGLWRIMDEAHISTIATHPDWRGRGYGELMLAGMMQRAMNLGAEYIVLEVRMSNVTAQNLYYKYGFQIAAVKHRYYRDNGEDAYDMRFYINDESCARFAALYQNTRTRLPFVDAYTAANPPSVKG